MRTAVERRIFYQYGLGKCTGGFAGEYTWEQLHGMVEDEMWGAPYRVLRKEERTITYGDWEAAGNG